MPHPLPISCRRLLLLDISLSNKIPARLLGDGDVEAVEVGGVLDEGTSAPKKERDARTAPEKHENASRMEI